MISPTRARGGSSDAVSLLMLGTTFMAFLPALNSVELDSAFLIDLGPALRLGAEVFVELLGCRGHGQDAGLLQPVGDDGIGCGLDHVVVDLLHDSGRRAGRRDEA